VIHRRIPHQFVLVLAFGLVAVGLAVAIVKSTTTAVRQAADTTSYAAVEVEGVRYLSGTFVVLRELLKYRADLVKATIESQNRPGAASVSSVAHRRRIGAISVLIAKIRDRSLPKSSLDAAVADQLRALENNWRSKASSATTSFEAVTAVVETIQPVLVSISGASGISNDPSIDGINFGDALVRFPLSWTYGTEAASIAGVNVAAGNEAFPDRIRVAQLLARAETAIHVGRQDAEDELAVNPAAGEKLARQAARNVGDFATMRKLITDRYVTSVEQPRRAPAERALTAHVAAFSSSSFAIIETLRQDLSGTLRERIEESRQQRSQLLLAAAGEVTLEAVLMLTLAWISVVSYRNGRRRMAAERVALELQRTELQGQLAQAKVQQELLGAKAQFRAVFDRAPIGMIILDRTCGVLDMNDAAAAMLRRAEKPICALNVIADHAHIVEQIFCGVGWLYSEEREYVDDQNRPRWFNISISPVDDETGKTLFAILMLRDITAAKALETQLVFDAGHDALTGLPNRNQFVTTLQRALDDRESTRSTGVFSVVFIDFNDFKTINDSFGHLAGDKFLVDGAARLRKSVRSSDVVARIGGDEFAILLHGSDRSEIEKHVARLQSVVSIPVNIEGQLVATSASFGIAQAESSYALAAEIIRDADTAMYHAKAQGGRNFVVFDAGMRERVVRRMQLSIDLVHALEHNELELFYQPIVDLADGTVAGCEALVRWRRADGSLVSPTEFLPLAEENGSIIEIGRWVTTAACEQMQSWNVLARAGRLPGRHEAFVIHVNLAVPEVHHVDLLSNLHGILKKTNVARDQIILEITEGIVLKNTERSRSTLDALTADGFRLCIDDFGTGYSSLRYLNDLPLHSFKIDRAFVSNGSGGLSNASIVEMLMALSRSLDLGVVAEGIETLQQWEELRELGCRYGQGYIFSKPVDGPAMTTILERDAALARRPTMVLPSALSA
jgi:diguanylate cyclase (GGDEF)-like protein/PAS domain S-box-containing protein